MEGDEDSQGVGTCDRWGQAEESFFQAATTWADGGAKLLPKVHSDRVGGNGHELEHKKELGLP